MPWFETPFHTFTVLLIYYQEPSDSDMDFHEAVQMGSMKVMALQDCETRA